MKHAVRAIVIKDQNLLVMKRNKFGQIYYTLPGGGVDLGETVDQALLRELAEEVCVQIQNPRLVFLEHAGEMYGTQHVYLCDYVSGEPMLHPDSEEAKITHMGKNIYQPMWVKLSELSSLPFRSEALKRAILSAVQTGFPEKPVDIDPALSVQ